jgi:hypothetical protein
MAAASSASQMSSLLFYSYELLVNESTVPELPLFTLTLPSLNQEYNRLRTGDECDLSKCHRTCSRVHASASVSCWASESRLAGGAQSRPTSDFLGSRKPKEFPLKFV